MSAFHERLLRVTQNTYLAAAGAFQAARFHRAETFAAGVMSMAAFVEREPDASPEQQAHGKVLFEQAKELAAQSRRMWIERETGGRLSGREDRVLRVIRRELDSIGEEILQATEDGIAG